MMTVSTVCIIYCTFAFVLTSESLHMHVDIEKGCKGVDGGG